MVSARGNPATRGFLASSAVTGGRRGAVRRALAGTNSGGRLAPSSAGSRAIRAAMPAGSTAVRDLSDMQWLLQRRGQRRDRTGIEGNHGERTSRRYGK